jgi:hypothetical protein
MEADARNVSALRWTGIREARGDTGCGRWAYEPSM